MPGKRVLLVEGSDDEHVLKHICGTRGVGHLDQIKPQGNVGQLLENFPVRRKEGDLGSPGVVVNANGDLMGRWSALACRLRQAGFQDVPRDPDRCGVILQPPKESLLPRAGVWIMPDNSSNGVLEDFLSLMIPAGSLLYEHARISVDGIPKGERRFSTAARPKALVHTWFAWQSDPGIPFGTAIGAGFLDPNAQHVDALVDWLRKLFFPGLPGE